jgi:hypothetical protein
VDYGSKTLDYLASYIISVLAGITVGLLAKPAWYLLSGLAMLVFSHLPNISGEWTARFSEPTETGGSEKITERITLHQLGRIVRGEGTVTDSRGRVFKYKGIIFRETFCGTYQRKGSHKSTRRGTFHLQIGGNENSMEGWCLWHDQDTDDIEASPYKWEKAH